MIRLLLTAILCLFPQVVLALGITDGPAPVPGVLSIPVMQGTYVYTVPEDFDPTGIGREGLTEIQNVARTLNFPFYVVIVDTLPDLTAEQNREISALGYGEMGDDLTAAYAVDKLAESWSGRGNYDTAKSTIFLLSYNPRKYRMLAGTKWKNGLGLHKETLAPFYNHFVEAVHGTPKDPKGGIIDTMRSFDEYVFDQVDPARIKARAEAEALAMAEAEKRQREKKLTEAKSALASLILEAKTMIKDDKQYLPPDTLALQTTIKRLEESPYMNPDFQDTPTIVSATNTLKLNYDSVRTAVDNARTTAYMDTFGTVMLALFYVAMTLMLAYFIYHLRRRNRERRAEFDEQYENWMAKIRAAAGRYVDAYADRDNIVGMVDTTGKTRELWDSLSAEIDDIWIGVKGIEDHLAVCLKRANQARWYSLDPILDAIGMLDAAFTFDTEKVNKDELFDRETKSITVIPQHFASTLAQRFKNNAASWDRIKVASNIRMPDNNASVMFPHTTLSRMLDEATVLGIPSDWYSDHPLAGDDTADQTVWKTADDIRWADPIAYMEAIEALRQQESVVVKRHEKLVVALGQIKAARVEDVPHLDSGVDATDDPQVTLSNARDTEHRLAGLLASNAQSKDVASVETLAKDVVSLYNKAKGQISTLEAALKDASKTVERALDEKDFTALDKQTADRIQAARAVHANVSVAVQDYVSGQTLASQAHGLGLDAKGALKKGRHLDALRAAEQAIVLFGNAYKAFNKAQAYCQCLDRNKAEFEQKLAQMGDLRDDYVGRVRRYNGPVAKLPAYRSPQELSVMDYAVALSLLTAQEAQWERVSREAQNAYEQAQAAERAERERQQRREREAAQAAAAAAAAESRRQSYDSYSSSSSSSSDSSGGSWGGGGGDSGGGSW